MEKKHSILIASSDSKIREMGRLAAETEGFPPILCGDGEEAVDSAKNAGDSIRLIVTEGFLPKADGFEVVRQLGEFPQTREIPILMLIESSKNKPAQVATHRAHSIRLCADDYLQKPIDSDEIRAQVHSMTKHFRAHKAPHPVTGLPGHPQFEHEVFTRLNRGETLGIACSDINHFRPFNDHYGTEKGNEVIRALVKTVEKVIGSFKFGPEREPVVAQVDGDDFMILSTVEDAEKIRQKLRQEFKAVTQKFYSKEEAKKGFYHEKDRNKKERIFPLMSLATAVIEVRKEKFAHYGEIVSLMNEMLRQSKVGSQDVQ